MVSLCRTELDIKTYLVFTHPLFLKLAIKSPITREQKKKKKADPDSLPCIKESEESASQRMDCQIFTKRFPSSLYPLASLFHLGMSWKMGANTKQKRQNTVPNLQVQKERLEVNSKTSDHMNHATN